MVLKGTTWYKKQYDTLEPLREVLKGSDGVPIVNLASAQAIHFHMMNRDTGELVLNDSNTIVRDNAAAEMEYVFPYNANEKAGTYAREWHIIWGPGVEQRVPNGKDLYLVEISRALAKT